MSNIGSSDGIQLFADTVIQYEDTVIWTLGQHTLKLGFQGMRERLDTFYSGNNGAAGIFSYNGQSTAGPSPTEKVGAGSGKAEAEFLGLPDDVGVGVNGGTWGQRANILSAFATDTWRASSNLTVTYGLRWELHTPWVEVKNRQANFTPFGGQEILAGSQESYYNNNQALYNQYNGIFNFQPRLGFAWTPGGKNSSVARGLHCFFLPRRNRHQSPVNHQSSLHRREGRNYTTQTLPSSTLDQGYVPIQSKTDPFHKTILRLWDPNFRPAVSQQWNFSIQHQFGNEATLQVGYVGQKTITSVTPSPICSGGCSPMARPSPRPISPEILPAERHRQHLRHRDQRQSGNTTRCR